MWFWIILIGVIAFVAGSFTSSWFKNAEIEMLNETISFKNRLLAKYERRATSPQVSPTPPKAP